jgi:ATP-binding cassette subfamily B multidrug efflux pump
MLRLFKYLKPYWLSILIAVAFLFVQADTNLALPDYMSNIVNIGLQQGGITSSVPEAIRASHTC